jgi:hypothetical protein
VQRFVAVVVQDIIAASTQIRQAFSTHGVISPFPSPRELASGGEGSAVTGTDDMDVAIAAHG